MLKKAFLGYLIALLALSFCSKNKSTAPGALEQPAGGTDVSGDNTGQSRDAREKTGKPVLRIRAVSLVPGAPTVMDDVLAIPELTDPRIESVDFLYQWFVNGRMINEIEGDKLSKTFFAKGAWLYCRIQAVAAEQKSAWFKSDAILARNSLPTLQLEPLADFNVPGDIRYQAAASDPDGDALTFEVLSPLDQGIVIDPRTGELSWRLTEDIVKALGESIEIQIAVSDGEGEKVTGTITLNLTSSKK